MIDHIFAHGHDDPRKANLFLAWIQAPKVAYAIVIANQNHEENPCRYEHKKLLIYRPYTKKTKRRFDQTKAFTKTQRPWQEHVGLIWQVRVYCRGLRRSRKITTLAPATRHSINHPSNS
ncbi:hypothetical protein M514_16337 [Trichuris suis]|uniref:Uncharacterized protein n=1 Tax=Trichuris suis TaxID=68888 RepID=A0A085NPK9_9BILA|nr:hypothetical protein M514_16337 [Trichuris suis]